ncbi:recombination regulator RecX [Macrococcus hajekii]|uniref:Regulatory protein RecX n=1 Tax=Macrococcus hajekii TaxID=198482 RepID=A0A4R6BI91_9STAP|nr:recombination regulator RecX [Macrococcus hajekii]TDM01278.1 recombination regulator RecX [Macrococcus hajekii]GGB10283.1 regulatory protein RecX [Macrococcus hajekii]
MKITTIEVQKHNKDRFNLYIDGDFSMGIDSATYVKFNLKKGDVISEEQLVAIKEYDDYRRAINSAVVYLSYKKRTEKEIREYLKKNETAEEIVDAVIKYCYDNRYIDHDDYARSLMNTMINTTDKGPDVFRQKLFEKGIERPIIDSYYDIYTEEITAERMEKLIDKQLKKHQGKASSYMAVQKTIQTLIQKGYNLDNIMPYLDHKDVTDHEALLKELEKQVNRWSKKTEGYELKTKVVTVLMRKGYKYDAINSALKESGIEDE